MIRQRKLVWHIYPPFLVMTLLALLALSAYTATALKSFFLEETRADLLARARLLTPQILPQLQPLDPEALDRLCKRIATGSETRITVIHLDGTILGDSHENPERMDNHADRPEIRVALGGKAGDSVRYSKTLSRQMMYVAIPLTLEEERVAVLRTSLPLTFIDEALRTLWIQLAGGGLLVAIAVSVVCLLIARRIIRPIEEMRRGAQRFAAGELSHRIRAPQALELAGLSEALNQMALQLEGRIQKVISQRNEREAILASMAEGVLAVDTDDRIISVNGAAADILGQPRKRMMERSVQEMIRSRDLHGMIRDTMSGGGRNERDIVLLGAQERIVHTRCTPLHDTDSGPMGVLLVLHDVTQLRRLENMRRDFAANVSHEIKTPLTAIKGFVETLHHDDLADPEETRRFMGIIQRHVNRLSVILDDLMQLSRIEREDELHQVRVRDENLETILQTAIQLCQPRLREKNISVDLHCEPNVLASVDPTLMEQAVVNLVDNAVKYSSAGSRIAVQARREEQEAVIIVRDEGMGIARKHLPRLFERFYRVDKARSRKLGGTGLGLAIVKHIVQAHQGRVSVDSVLGQGSTFRIHLPPAGEDADT